MTEQNNNGCDVLRCRLKQYVSRFDALVFASAFGAALFTHLYMLTHKFLNHDDINGLLDDNSFGLSSGRWLLHFLTRLTGSFSSSYVNGVAGALFLALAVVLTVRLFEIKRLLPALLIGVCMVAFPTVASTYAYMFCSYQYLFSLSVAVLGAWLLRRATLPSMAAGVAAIALAMGCYQAYFCLAAALLVLSLIVDLCRDRWAGKAMPCLLTGVRYVVCLALGMALYYAVLKLCLWCTGTELVSYQGISGMGEVTFAVLLERIGLAYTRFFPFYANQVFAVFHGAFPMLVWVSFAADAAVLAAAVWKRKLYRRPASLALLAVLVALLPLASNLVCLMTDQANIHLLMVYPMLLPLLIPAIAADGLALRRRSLSALCAGALLAIQLLFGYEFVLVTNRAYFSMDITYQNVTAFFTKLTAKIELQEGFTPDTPVALIGYAKMDSAIPETNMTGVPVGNYALNLYSRVDYLRYFLATEYRFAPEDVRQAILLTEEFQQMPAYPAAGSIAMIDGVLTVKF